MRSLRLPALPRFGAPEAPRPAATAGRARPERRPQSPSLSQSASLRDVPIRLRVSPTAVELSAVPLRRTPMAAHLSFASFARALHDASDADTTVDVEAFCAEPARPAPPAAGGSAGVLPPPARVEPVAAGAAPSFEEAADLAAIRQSAGAPAPTPTPVPTAAATSAVPASTPRSTAPASRPPQQGWGGATAAPAERPHNAFDATALATTFDAGTVSLERRFRDLDTQLDREAQAATRRAVRAAAVAAQQSTPIVVKAPAAVPFDAPVVDDAVLGDDLWRLRSAVVPARPLSVSVAAGDIPLAPERGGQSIDVRALIPGDIIVSTVLTSPVSAAIRLGTGVPVSHTLLYLGDSQVAEAIETGVVVRTIHEAVAGSELAVAFRVPELSAEQASEVVRFARAQQGKAYNYFGVVRQAVFRLDDAIYCRSKTGEARDRCRQWLGRVLLGPGNSDTYFCSQLVLDAYRHAGAPLATTPPVWGSPADVVELALTKPWAYVGHLKAPIPG